MAVGSKQKSGPRVVEQLIHLRSKSYEMQKLVGVDEVETAIRWDSKYASGSDVYLKGMRQKGLVEIG
jgi:hypothetical protein